MTHIVVDMNNPTPPYEQVRREIVEQIRTGELRPGDRLPAIRVLAGDLGLAPGTVARAYTTLEQQGLIRTRRSRGTTVIAPASAPPADARTAAATAAIIALTISTSLAAETSGIMISGTTCPGPVACSAASKMARACIS